MERLQVRLDQDEAKLLARVAADELRDPREQLRFLLREDLKRRGLLPQQREAATAAQTEVQRERR